jgi:hypothetical protein
MSQTAAQPATTPIPVQLSEPEFDAFILPHLSMPKRGPKCKLGYYRVFNLILWLLYTGMQWKCRSYWIPGAYTPPASEKRSSFLRPLKNKVFQKSGVTPIALDDLGTSTPLESHKSLGNNRHLIPNYGERYRNGEAIATGFVESTVNQVVSKRFCKKQQMQWTKRGAHLLLQTCVKTLNGELGEVFKRWYPDMQVEELAEAA